MAMRWRRLGDDRGQSLVEFAFASVLFFITVFGIITFGLAVWQYNMMSNLAQEGARWASVHGSAAMLPAEWSDVQTYVHSRALNFNVTLTAATLAAPAPKTLGTGSAVTVGVQSTFNPLTGLIPHAALHLQSTATMVVSR
jgi:Flp pilus assembly protein TadG